MSLHPKVSVVMSVYNGANDLSETLESVLNQQDCDFEFIVVNDGSIDASADILNDYAARDDRLQVIHQGNTGLTRALIRGCSQARGVLIARQDSGDISLPGRLKHQSDFLSNHDEAVMTGAAVEFVGPLYERLYVISKPMTQLDAGLRKLDMEHLSGPPHHGATMFRTEAYRKVGGYQPSFIVGQDLDLWLRLAELGTCLGTAEVLYQARLQVGSISSRRRDEQIRAGKLALACARRRQSGGNDQDLMDAYSPKISQKTPVDRFEVARFNYFVASCLNGHDRKAAKSYYRAVLKQNPLHLKAFLRLIVS